MAEHGTASRYRGGCRCDACRAAEADRMRARRRRSGALDVTCWCEHTTVRVDPTELRAGRTKTCGRANCQP